MANVLGRIGSCFIQDSIFTARRKLVRGKLLPSEIAVSGGIFLWGLKSNKFAEYELSCLFLPLAKQEADGPPILAPTRLFPCPPGQAAQPVFLLRQIEAACGELFCTDGAYRTGRSCLPYRTTLSTFAQGKRVRAGRTARIAPLK